MIRLLKLAVALTAVLIVAVLAMRAIGGTQPSPIAALFTNPDGSPCIQPCLLGARPEMSLTEAADIVQSHPLMRGFNRVDNVGRSAVEFNLDQNRAVGIYVNPSSSRADLLIYFQVYGVGWRNSTSYTMGNLINLVGQPQSATFVTNNCAKFIIPKTQFAFVIITSLQDTDCGRPETQIFSIIFTYLTDPTLSLNENGSMPWLGFATSRRYTSIANHNPQ